MNITREEAIKKIEELKKYVEQEDNDINFDEVMCTDGTWTRAVYSSKDWDNCKEFEYDSDEYKFYIARDNHGTKALHRVKR